ncbi:MAG TPA: DMT family transporter [Geminicoccaceae bacterium]
MPASGILLLVSLTILWGLNWPAMKLALSEIPPWSFRTMCLLGGGLILLSLTAAQGERVRFELRILPTLMLVSVFNITAWHLLTAYGLLHTSSGRAAIIGYTMPLWASVLSVLVLKVRIGAREVAALGLGMAALALLVAEDLRTIGTSPLGPLLIGLAALGWGLGTVLIKRFAPWPMPVMALTGWQQLIGAIPIVIGWWLLEPVPDLGAVSPWAIGGLIYAVTVAMVFCHTAYFKLVELLPAHVAAISTLAIPAVGVISGALILGERVGGAEIGALLLVIGGLFLLLRPGPR